ncbi:MAG: DUF11 domain-containing protein, partial [Chloroflexi bacterium]
DTGDSATCLATDQRGVSRPQGAGCDIGAYEYDYAGIYYVKPTASGAANCQTWADACDLQTALTTASSGDEIWVAAGTHKPSLTGNRSASFTLKNGVGVYGGFAVTETLRSQRNYTTNVTILSGDLNGDDGGFTNNGENSYHVVYGSGVNATAILDGFTISGGNANGDYPDDSGGGMYNVTNSAPTLTNVTFSGNTAKFNGGGMYNATNSAPALTNVTFSGNTAELNGGGIYNFGSSPTLTNATFSGNSASNGYGGGICNSGSSPSLTSVTFSGNSASGSGGGMANRSTSHPTLTNATFSANSAAAGGGLYNESTSNPMLNNVTFSGNSANNGSGGGMHNANSSPTLKNVIIANSASGGDCVNFSSSLNAASANNLMEDSAAACDLLDGVNGNLIGQDPMLAALANHGGSTQTFALLPGSPAIDAGDDATCAAVPVNNLDQRGITRPQGAACDIGAFESRGFALTKTSGDHQSTPIQTTFPNPLVVSVTSAAGEPVNGGQVIFTAPASGASLTTTPITLTISQGVVSSTVTANSILGAYSVVANALGAANVAFDLANDPASTTTAIASALNPSVVGQAVTFTATVTSTLGVPSGSVQFYADGAALGSPVMLSNGQASLSTSVLAVGTHPITATYGGDGFYGQSYSAILVQEVKPSSNAALSSLALSSGALNPAFAPATSHYTVTLPYKVASLVVTPTAAGPGAMIQVNGSTVASGSPSAPIALSVGDNTLTILVTAQDGVTTRTYTVSVVRQVQVTADLSLTIRASEDPVIAGVGLVYSLTIGNQGPFPATGVSLVDTLPAGVTFQNATAGCSQAG